MAHVGVTEDRIIVAPPAGRRGIQSIEHARYDRLEWEHRWTGGAIHLKRGEEAVLSISLVPLKLTGDLASTLNRLSARTQSKAAAEPQPNQAASFPLGPLPAPAPQGPAEAPATPEAGNITEVGNAPPVGEDAFQGLVSPGAKPQDQGRPRKSPRRRGGKPPKVKRPLGEPTKQRRSHPNKVLVQATATPMLIWREGMPHSHRGAWIKVTSSHVIYEADMNIKPTGFFAEMFSDYRKVVLNRIPVGAILTVAVAPRELLDGPWLQLWVRGRKHIISIETPEAAMLAKVIEQLRRAREEARSPAQAPRRAKGPKKGSG